MGSWNASLARLITGALPGMIVDHINGDTLDNRRANLRVCTMAQNVRNRKKPRTNTSGYKGVHWMPRHKKWMAKITCAGKHIFLGLFDDPAEAHAAYCAAAKKYHGDFARFD